MHLSRNQQSYCFLDNTKHTTVNSDMLKIKSNLRELYMKINDSIRIYIIRKISIFKPLSS